MNEVCEKCGGTGIRPLTEEEMDDELESNEPEEVMDTCHCDCEVGQARSTAFWDKWGPIVEEAVRDAQMSGPTIERDVFAGRVATNLRQIAEQKGR